MSASPWAPSSQTGGQQTAPVLPPPPMTQPGPPQAGPPLPPGAPQHQPRPPRRRGPWLLVVAAVLVLIAAVAATAAITYAVARDTTAPTADPSQPITPQAPQYTAAEQAAAKQSICNVFDVSARGQRGQGGMRINGDVNLQLVVRTVNSIIAVENALTPAVPEEITSVARRYVDTSLAVTTAATGNTPIEDVNRLTDVSNEATYAFADACGLQG